jgi:hypothetical protein
MATSICCAKAVVVTVTVMVTGGVATVSVALLKSAHRIVDRASIVRSFTILDVVDSSSLQLGLFLGGLLITAGRLPGGTTVHSVYAITATAIATVAVLGAMRAHASR